MIRALLAAVLITLALVTTARAEDWPPMPPPEITHQQPLPPVQPGGGYVFLPVIER